MQDKTTNKPRQRAIQKRNCFVFDTVSTWISAALKADAGYTGVLAHNPMSAAQSGVSVRRVLRQ